MRNVEMIFNDDDFSDLMYNIFSVDESINLLSKFKGLSLLTSFVNYKIEDPLPGNVDLEDKKVKQNLDRNRVIRYIICAYDRNSPILQKFQQDEIKRKTISAMYAGFQCNDDGYFDKDVTDMMMCKYNDINSMIIDYVRQYNDPEYSLLVTGYEAYYKKLNHIMMDDEASKRDTFQMEETKGKLFSQAKAMASDLDKLAAKILTDNNKLLKSELYCLIDQQSKNKLNITPERLAGIA